MSETRPRGNLCPRSTHPTALAWQPEGQLPTVPTERGTVGDRARPDEGKAARHAPTEFELVQPNFN
jgi:hypothetical protein